MIHKFVTPDSPTHPSKPSPPIGAMRWVLSFPLGNGDILQIEIGELGRNAILEMLQQEGRDDEAEIQELDELAKKLKEMDWRHKDVISD